MSAKFEKMRKNARYWMAFNVVLAAVIVVISGFLKVRG
jgi:arginine exporter protein ArgO